MSSLDSAPGQAAPVLSLDSLSSESLGLIADYCELEHVALLFCCGSRLLIAKLSSVVGVHQIQSSSRSRTDWIQFPAFLGVLEGLKSVSLETSASSASVAFMWSDLLDLLPKSIENLSLTIVGPTTNVDVDLLDSRLPFLKSLCVSFEKNWRSPIVFDFPFQEDWPNMILTKLALDFRFLVPSNHVLAFPSALTDLTWGGEREEKQLAADLVWFSSCSRLVRLRLPYVDQLILDVVKRRFPVDLTYLELPRLLEVQLEDKTLRSNSDQFAAMLPPRLKHFESASAIKWSNASSLKTVTSWKLSTDYFRAFELVCFPENLQSLVVDARQSDVTYGALLQLLPSTMTDLHLPHMKWTMFPMNALPPRLTRLYMGWNPDGPFKAHLPISLTDLHLEAPLPRLQQWARFSLDTIDTSIPPLPRHVTRFSTSSGLSVRLTESDKTTLNWDISSDWISPLIVVVYDRIDLMYECFERGWCHEPDFENWHLFMVAIRHGSLKFLGWALSRRFTAEYYDVYYNTKYGSEDGLVITTALANGRLDVIEMLEEYDLDISYTPTPSIISLAVASDNAEMLARMTTDEVDFLNVDIPNSSPLTEALCASSRNSTAYLKSIGCFKVDFTALLMRAVNSGSTRSLELANEFELWTPFEAPENVAHFVKHWNPNLLPPHEPQTPQEWDKWLKGMNLENPPLRFRAMFFLRYLQNSDRKLIFEWMNQYGFLDPSELIESAVLVSEPCESGTPLSSPDRTYLSSSPEVPTTVDATAGHRTILSFYLDFLSRYSVNDVSAPNLLNWLFYRDPLVEELQ